MHISSMTYHGGTPLVFKAVQEIVQLQSVESFPNEQGDAEDSDIFPLHIASAVLKVVCLAMNSIKALFH